MRLSFDRPAVVCAAAVSLFTAVAAVGPSTAWADETVPTELPSVASLADAATTAATDAVGAASTPEVAADTVTPPALDVAPVADAPETTPSEPAPTAPAGDTATQDPAAMPDPATQTAPSGDITPTTTDTAADTPPAATQAKPSTTSTAAPPPATPPPVSANINVSVRIDSPGDNGSVTQVNVSGGSVTPLSTAAAAEKTPVAPTTSSQPQSSAAPPAPPVASGSSDSWYWTWDCLGAPPISAISPTGSATGSFPSSWTWIWNCGDNSTQYQSETRGENSQINTNIAIRISSPGDDGSVTQVNVGAAVTIPMPREGHGAPFLPSPVNVPPALESAPGVVPAELGSVLAAAPLLDTTDITAVLDTGAATDVATEPVSAIPFAAPGAPLAAQTTRRHPPDRRAGDVQTIRIPMAPVVRYAPATTSAVDAAWRAASPASAVGSKAPSRPPEATAAPRTAQQPSRAPVISVSGVSAGAAAGGTGGSGSGLPLLLALPFVAALLDLARRVALEHATWPSGHRRRVPDRPG